MWVRRSAIRPVPRFARVPGGAVAAVEAMLSGKDERMRSLARQALERFETEQRPLARYVIERLEHALDEATLALGRMLAVGVFLAFEAVPGLRLRRSTEDEVSAVDAALAADEELRRSDAMDALDSEDIVAIEQPALVTFVNEHIGRTLEQHAGTIDVDHVAAVFRAVLVEILALSYAVEPPPGHAPPGGFEPMA